jgi:hypothetical protein
VKIPALGKISCETDPSGVRKPCDPSAEKTVALYALLAEMALARFSLSAIDPSGLQQAYLRAESRFRGPIKRSLLYAPLPDLMIPWDPKTWLEIIPARATND